MTSDPVWLTAEEERVWRGWMRLNVQLAGSLLRQVQEEAGLSMSDYEVLVHLTDDPEGRVRVSDLARLLQWERSRLSHHLTRMERRGLVERRECQEDGRGAFVAVTDAGVGAIEKAAPGHAGAVRRLVFDVLDEGEVTALAGVVDKLLNVVEDAAGTPRTPRGTGSMHS